MDAKRTSLEGDFVLYWMLSTHRLHENWALRFAILQADRLNPAHPSGLRMLWGKHVVSWTSDYGDALRWLIHLNNKYGLDGRDPSSYAGVQWCLGKFDRTFYTRPVLGVIRPMSLKRAREKWYVEGYVRRWTPRVG